VPVLLPASPGPASVTPAYLGVDIDQTSPLNGVTQRVSRPGGRFALQVSMPPMVGDVARDWLGALLLAQTSTALLAFPQPDFTAAGGVAAVNGGGQTGSTLNLTLTPDQAGATLRRGQFVSILASFKRYLHVVTADTAAVGQALALPIFPMLRVSPSNGEAVNLSLPIIEGLLEGNRREWTLDAARFVGLTFTIVETR
jgi:hypothetical protein